MFKSVARTSVALTIAIVLGTAVAVMAGGGGASEAALWAVALALGARIVPILASFPIAYWPRAGGRVPPLGAGELARVVAAETWATIKLFFFYHPFEKFIGRLDPDRTVDGGMPIVLVHGFYANAGFWRPTQRRLASAGWSNVFSLNLEPLFASIDDYAVQLARCVDDVCARCAASSVIVVAHSMGGLVARAYARQAPDRIRHIVCLGTPHEGTVLASLVPSETTRQMRPGSDWLAVLNSDRPTSAKITNIYSEHDNIIVPQAGAALTGAENNRLRGIGHLEMAFSSTLQSKLEAVLERLQRSPST